MGLGKEEAAVAAEVVEVAAAGEVPGNPEILTQMVIF